MKLKETNPVKAVQSYQKTRDQYGKSVQQMKDLIPDKVISFWKKERGLLGPFLAREDGEGYGIIEQTGGATYDRGFYLCSFRAGLGGLYRCCQQMEEKTREDAEDELCFLFNRDLLKNV